MKVKFNDIIIEVPTSWQNIRLGDYERWFMRQPQNKMEYVELVADVCNTDAEVLLNAPTEMFNAIVDGISFVSEQDFTPSNRIEIGGETYSISFSDELTLSEWVDVENVLESDSPTQISEMLAILCRPADEKYDTKTAESRRDTFRNLTCDKAMPLIAFFLHKKAESEKILHLCSTVKDQTDRLLKDICHFAESGDGIKSLPIWPRIKYTVLMKYWKRRLSKYSDSCSTKWTDRQPKKSRRSLFSR